MATNSGEVGLDGGQSRRFGRTRGLVLTGAVCVLGLVSGVVWTLVRDDPASSDSGGVRRSTLVAASADELQAPAARPLAPTHAALPLLPPPGPPGLLANRSDTSGSTGGSAGGSAGNSGGAFGADV